MRTNPHDQPQDRRALPRLLVGRRTFSHLMQEAIADVPLECFSVGDMITFEDCDGDHHVITILKIRPYGAVDAMAYNGVPHYVPTTADAIKDLLIVHRERMHLDDVAAYLCMLDLGDRMEVAA